ncbi:MAG: alpha/beta fold hydrolase [Myxococcaceae bacterium]
MALLTGCASWYAHPLPAEAKTHRARTADGWELELVQYLPEVDPTGRPILLCAGISANGRHMDLDEDRSLARWFAARGREVWIMSIRGTGGSDRVDPSKGRPGGYSFDTVWQQDTRAAVAYVRANAATPGLAARAVQEGRPVPAHVARLANERAPLIDYVGHSMGGMLMYAYLSQGGEGIHAAATLGSPTRLDFGGEIEASAVATTDAIFAKDVIAPVEGGALVSMPLQGRVELPVDRLVYNPENIPPETWRRLVAIGTGDISGAVWFQVAQLMRTGRFESLDGTVDYRRDMSRIRVPVLVVAGKADRLASPPAVKDGFRALGGPKEWLLLAEENGAVADYGHVDLIVGTRADEELWPRVLDFFERQAGASH